MKRFSLFSLSLLVGLVASLAAAFAAGTATKAKTTAAKSGAACVKTCDTKSGPVTLMGPVKAAPSARMFVMTPKGGDVKVNATRAVVRESGKKVSFAAIKKGTVVKVSGNLRHRVLRAKEVCICTETQKH